MAGQFLKKLVKMLNDNRQLCEWKFHYQTEHGECTAKIVAMSFAEAYQLACERLFYGDRDKEAGRYDKWKMYLRTYDVKPVYFERHS